MTPTQSTLTINCVTCIITNISTKFSLSPKCIAAGSELVKHSLYLFSVLSPSLNDFLCLHCTDVKSFAVSLEEIFLTVLWEKHMNHYSHEALIVHSLQREH